jgi:hypothetical protein
LWLQNATPGAEARLLLERLRGAEAPLFHGCAGRKQFLIVNDGGVILLKRRSSTAGARGRRLYTDSAIIRSTPDGWFFFL